jgi:predicted DNA-binding antitoxin AbrB/MazE fold protein
VVSVDREVDVMTIKAVFEGGVFRPTEPVTLREGTTVEVVVVPAEVSGADPRGLAAEFRRIAALPIEPGGENFSNRDHDRILYGSDKPK